MAMGVGRYRMLESESAMKKCWVSTVAVAVATSVVSVMSVVFLLSILFLFLVVGSMIRGRKSNGR
jgi:hypothetical protein